MTTTLKKVTKGQIKAKIKRGETWLGYVCPSKFYPNDTPFNMCASVEFNDIDKMEKYLNEFYYYNCGTDTGKKIHFYER
jgi:hypothetical protein